MRNLNIFGRNSQITINGKSYSGNNITVNNGVVTVDGKIQGSHEKEEIKLTILCNVDKIVSNESITIYGDVVGNVEANTSVNCDGITGDVVAGTSVNCDDIQGSARAGTTINCDVIHGSAVANKINK